MEITELTCSVKAVLPTPSRPSMTSVQSRISLVISIFLRPLRSNISSSDKAAGRFALWAEMQATLVRIVTTNFLSVLSRISEMLSTQERQRRSWKVQMSAGMRVLGVRLANSARSAEHKGKAGTCKMKHERAETRISLLCETEARGRPSDGISSPEEMQWPVYFIEGQIAKHHQLITS